MLTRNDHQLMYYSNLCEELHQLYVQNAHEKRTFSIEQQQILDHYSDKYSHHFELRRAYIKLPSWKQLLIQWRDYTLDTLQGRKYGI